MDLGLTGRAAIVLTAGKGLGKACALSLAAEGCRVAFCARNRGQIAAADVSRASDINRFTADVLSRWSRIDILVNNAGRIKSVM